jgi:hypothetical protein
MNFSILAFSPEQITPFFSDLPVRLIVKEVWRFEQSADLKI